MTDTKRRARTPWRFTVVDTTGDLKKVFTPLSLAMVALSVY